MKLLIGDSFDVKTNNKNINCKQDGSVLKIKESGVVNSKNKWLRKSSCGDSYR